MNTQLTTSGIPAFPGGSPNIGQFETLFALFSTGTIAVIDAFLVITTGIPTI